MKSPSVLRFKDQIYLGIVTNSGERYTFTFRDNIRDISNIIEIICNYIDDPDLGINDNEGGILIDVIEQVTGINYFLLKGI